MGRECAPATSWQGVPHEASYENLCQFWSLNIRIPGACHDLSMERFSLLSILPKSVDNLQNLFGKWGHPTKQEHVENLFPFIIVGISSSGVRNSPGTFVPQHQDSTGRI